MYYHLWSTSPESGDINPSFKQREGGEGGEAGEGESKKKDTDQEIRIEELPGHEGALGRVVLLATGRVEDALRRAVDDRRESDGRGGFFLGGGGRLRAFVRSLYQRQVRRVAVKNQRMKRRVRMVGGGLRRLCRWMKGMEEEGRRV